MSIIPPPRQIQIAIPSTGEDEWQALRDPLESGWLTQGPKVAEFERQFAQRHRVAHALATTSATTGLHLALAALGIGPGDEVIVPSFTWVATANAVLYCGATPVIADIDPKTFNLDPEQVSARLTVHTRAVIAVHLFGLCADMDAIKRILPPGVTLVEDAACAAGASYRGMPAGSLGEVGVFSFHPRKSITTGEGGMLTTNNAELAARAEQLRSHGATVSEEVRHRGARPYLLPDFNLLGFNYRMTDLQAAVGIVQLRKLDVFIDERSRAARYYNDRLSHLSWLKFPQEPIDGRHAWQSFVSYVDEQQAPMSRNQMMDRLQQKGIATRPGTHAVHMLGYYRDRFEYAADDFPNARDANNRSLAIPLHNRMSAEDYAYVAETILNL
jgi:dTDP-4-amino-4,6-dideoxygalactose transaminase